LFYDAQLHIVQAIFLNFSVKRYFFLPIDLSNLKITIDMFVV